MYLSDATTPNAIESALGPLLNLYQQKELIKAQADLVRARGAVAPVQVAAPTSAMPYLMPDVMPMTMQQQYDMQAQQMRVPVPQRNTMLLVGLGVAALLGGYMLLGGRGRRR